MQPAPPSPVLPPPVRSYSYTSSSLVVQATRRCRCCDHPDVTSNASGMTRSRLPELMLIHVELGKSLPYTRACGFRPLVIIFLQKGNKAVISFSYACVRTKPAGMRCRTQLDRTIGAARSIFFSIDMNNKSMQIPFFRLIL